MMQSTIAANAFAVKARLIVPMVGSPLTNDVLTISGEQIVAVGENLSESAPHDLGSVAILPGFVNAHTHLEFSDLFHPLGSAGMPLPDWIREVIDFRKSAPDAAAAIRRGLRESARGGVTTLGEIASSEWPRVETDRRIVDATVFREWIGPRRDQFDGVIREAGRALDESSSRQDFRIGLSPHAPYTVPLELLAPLVDMAAEAGAPVAMHLAESPEEIELLATSAGPFRELLEQRGAWDAAVRRSGRRVLDYLQILDAAPRALVVHGAYLDDEEIDFLAARVPRMAVVYCPRTHAYFGHRAYPLAKMLARGVTIALGTDSRASNPDLSILEELRFVASRHGDVPLDRVLELGTLGGARALGLGPIVGSLEAGKRADLAVVPIAEPKARDPLEFLFESNEPVSRVMHRGAWLNI